MHIVVLAIMAFALGFIWQLIIPKLQAVIPANVQQGKILGAFFTGAFILVAVFLASFLLGALGMKRSV